jgi:hypothetical protein
MCECTPCRLFPAAPHIHCGLLNIELEFEEIVTRAYLARTREIGLSSIFFVQRERRDPIPA